MKIRNQVYMLITECRRVSFDVVFVFFNVFKILSICSTHCNSCNLFYIRHLNKTEWRASFEQMIMRHTWDKQVES